MLLKGAGWCGVENMLMRDYEMGLEIRNTAFMYTCIYIFFNLKIICVTQTENKTLSTLNTDILYIGNAVILYITIITNNRTIG